MWNATIADLVCDGGGSIRQPVTRAGLSLGDPGGLVDVAARRATRCVSWNIANSRRGSGRRVDDARRTAAFSLADAVPNRAWCAIAFAFALPDGAPAALELLDVETVAWRSARWERWARERTTRAGARAPRGARRVPDAPHALKRRRGRHGLGLPRSRESSQRVRSRRFGDSRVRPRYARNRDGVRATGGAGGTPMVSSKNCTIRSLK